MLPKDLPDCRVLTFSYPASVAAVFGRTSSDTILQHATTLVQELAADRQVSSIPLEKLLIAIAHNSSLDRKSNRETNHFLVSLPRGDHSQESKC